MEKKSEIFIIRTPEKNDLIEFLIPPDDSRRRGRRPSVRLQYLARVSTVRDGMNFTLKSPAHPPEKVTIIENFRFVCVRLQYRGAHNLYTSQSYVAVHHRDIPIGIALLLV